MSVGAAPARAYSQQLFQCSPGRSGGEGRLYGQLRAQGEDVANRSRYAEIAEVLAAEIADRRPVPGSPASTRSPHGSRSAGQPRERRCRNWRAGSWYAGCAGAGTFVNRPIDYVLSQRKVAVDASDRPGGRRRTRAPSCATSAVAADRASRRPLERPEGSAAHLLVRQSYIDGLLNGWSKEWIPADVLPELNTAVHAVESLDTILRQMCRLEPVRAWCRVSYSLPGPDVAAHLEMETGRPVWLVESLSRDLHTGAAVMCSNTWSRPDSTRIIVEMDGPWEHEREKRPDRPWPTPQNDEHQPQQEGARHGGHTHT